MMTLAEVVSERLHQMFVRLARDIGSGHVDIALTQDETAGVPLVLFRAEQMMSSAFERFVTSGEVSCNTSS